MTRADIQEHVTAALQTIAPEIDPSTLDAYQPLRDQVDLDSMDWLRFMMELHRRLDIDVRETEYHHLGTLADAVDYLSLRVGAIRA